jgi:hypothetical protein
MLFDRTPVESHALTGFASEGRRLEAARNQVRAVITDESTATATRVWMWLLNSPAVGPTTRRCFLVSNSNSQLARGASHAVNFISSKCDL